MYNRLIAILIFIPFNYFLSAQSNNSPLLAFQYAQLKDSIERQYKLNKLNKTKPHKSLPKYKHWARNSYWMSSHLEADGSIPNIAKKNFQYWKKNRSDKNARQLAYGSWSFIGPSSTTGSSKGLGRVDRIEFHPTNGNIIYAGTPAGGLWRTIDGGVNWECLTDELPSLGISGIVVDRTSPSRIYILTGTGDGNGFSSYYNYRQASVGVLLSTNGGYNWEFTGAFPNTNGTFFGYKMEQSPTNPDYFLATTNVGLYRSLDRGATWTKVFGGQCHDIEFSHSTNKAFVTTGPSFAGCVVSEDNFDSWNPIVFSGSSPTASGRWEMATSPGEPCRYYLFCGTGDGANDSFNGFYESLDCGNTFVARDNTPNILGASNFDGVDGQSQYDMAIACNPAAGQSHIVLTGGLVVYRSLNHGAGWTENTDYFEQGNDPGSYIHPDIHDLAYNPLNGNVYAATDGGVYFSNNNGSTWNDISSGLESSMIYNMAGTHLSDYKLLTGHQDNGVQYRSGNTLANQFLQTGDGFSVQFSPTNSSEGYSTVNQNMYKWTNNFSNISYIVPSQVDPDNHFFPRILVHNTNPNRLICSYSVTHYSNSGGSSWTTPDLSDNGRGFHALVSCPSNSERVYAAGGTAYNSSFSLIYRSDDFGEEWIDIGTTPGYPDVDARVTGIAVDPNQSANVWVAMGQLIDGQKVYYSTNAGGSWANMTADLPNIVVNCIATDENNGVYIGTDMGVFYRNIFSAGWTPFSNQLPNTPVTSLIANNDLNVIRAATYGRGVWQSPFYTACLDDLVLNDLEGDFFYQAHNTINVFGEMKGGVGTKGTLRSGQLNFFPGFESRINQKLNFEIGACGTGGLPTTYFNSNDQIQPQISKDEMITTKSKNN